MILHKGTHPMKFPADIVDVDLSTNLAPASPAVDPTAYDCPACGEPMSISWGCGVCDADEAAVAEARRISE